MTVRIVSSFGVNDFSNATSRCRHCNCFFFFNVTATTETYTLSDTLSLHDALPIFPPGAARRRRRAVWDRADRDLTTRAPAIRSEEHTSELQSPLNISYAVFCL